MAKPRLSILDRRFKYTNAVETDVGATFRRELRKLDKAGRATAADFVPPVSAVVRQLRKRNAS